MPTDCVSFKNTGYFSKLICDYLDQKEHLKSFYNRFPYLENFKFQIEEKQSSFSDSTRAILVESLNRQYQNTEISEQTEANIALLQQQNTFTITTGHQLNLFTGPLYFLYKIIATINLCKELKSEYPHHNFVPIYWMATEDHDFEEINYFNFKSKKVKWNREASGAVGELNLEGLDEVFNAFVSQLDSSINAKHLKQLFKKAYLEHENLTQAMRFLVNALFADYGLVILDGNDRDLKQVFIPYIQDELVNKTSFKEVSESNLELSNRDTDYKIQVNPRPINLFYIKQGLRERIVEFEGTYSVVNTQISWSQTALLKEVNDFPERFSPNVILRPLYQEVVLPNLCYIGGGGELAYWLQLKTNFEKHQVTFPILLLRNSVLLITSKQKEKLQKLKIPIADLFLKQNDLLKKVTKDNSKIAINFSSQKAYLKKQFEDLYTLAAQTDKSFLGAVAAQEKKQIKGLENLEKRLLKAQKFKLNDVLTRVSELQNKLFPGNSLQERNLNFAEFYLEYGDQLIQQLALNLQPLKGEFLILELE